ncbi:MAG TPA: aminotransferase class III-fold pyridoxal phosphate-dependent enzyme [Vicinamibacterales bacterium]|nr:aminotransferase class III-fold pyridoxal phosphate-dependent enzyme [Vicinamibacterales bacterium]
MSLLQQAPRFDAAGAAQLARDLYGLDATASPLPSERDQNFLLATAEGERFVLKVANATEPRELLEAQNAAMEHVAALGFCPRVRAAAGGGTIARASSGHFVRLLSWLPGTPLGGISARPDSLLEDLGHRLGRFSAALAAFDHPAIHRPFHWDLARGFEIIDEHAPLIDDPALRGFVRRMSSCVQARDGRRLDRVRRSAVHGDANDFNVLVDTAAPDGPRVTGLIDFGDMVHSYTAAEPAVAVAYAVLDHPDPLRVAAAIVRGYHAAHPLTHDELSVLFGLVQLRLCVSVCMAAHQLRQRPGDEYLSISQAPIRRTLPTLARIHPDTAEEALRAACGLATPAPAPPVPKEVTLARRRQRLGSNLSVAYADPVKVVRGWMQYLFDADGRVYLDAYNNVPHAGHSHPRIVRAVTDQMRAVNTNTRYLHDTIWRFAERLCATLPDPLAVCYFVNSGSEANELALRLARAHTRARDLVVLDAAYHGNTTTLIEISPYKFNGRGGLGAPEWVHVAPIPDDYRGPHRRGDPDAGRKYGDAVGGILEDLRRRGRAIAGFIAETCPSVGGQIIPPPAYLETVYRHVRGAGGVCIADEVQTGLGRMGTGFYAFESQEVVPDIVVLGKPLGNGYPLGAVVTTRAIADSFDNGMEFFSTFGGSTVSCAAGLAVVETVEEEGLQAHALRVGSYLLSGLHELAARHESVGDVRGSGLFLGLELVRDRGTQAPATDQASRVVDRLREAGILLGTEGPFHNVLKIRPPMPFNEHDADFLLATLDDVLRAGTVEP